MKQLKQFDGRIKPSFHFSLKKSFWMASATVLLVNTAFARISNTENTHYEKILLSENPQQEFLIKGKVQDAATKSALSGVTLKILGKATATSTDENGSFELKVSANDIIEFSYIGYKKTEYKVSGPASNLLIDLTDETGSLEEVVVTGYSTQRKKDLTGSVAVVDVNQLKTQPVASAVEALQGRATGVQIVTDGAPGSTPQIKIRGFSTINNNEPLYVIDGVPFEGKLSWLNQNDIESMQVLKDASAASIYGARANNGVIIITTKSGKSGKAQINLDAYYGVQVPNSSRFPKMITPQQELDIENRLTGNSNTLPDYLVAGSKTGHDITQADIDMAKYNYRAKSRADFYQITKANKEGTNWFKELSQNAPTQSYQLSAAGGTDDAKYAMSAGYLGQKGTIIHTGFDKFNVRANTSFSALNKKLRFGENLQYSFTEGYGIGVNTNTAGDYIGEGSALGFAYRIHNIIPVYDEGGNFAGSLGGKYGNGENPVAIAYRAKDNKNKNNFFFGNAFTEYDIIDGLTLRTNFGLKYENYNGVSYRYPNPEFTEGNFSNSISEYFGFTTEWTWTNTLNYRKTFGDHNLNILAGTEAIQNRYRQLDGSGRDLFTMSSLDYLYLGAASGQSSTSEGTVGSMFSLFGKVDYSFKDRYILSATIRRDGSSNFGSANKYGVFPGVSGAWRVSEEEFLKGTSWLSDLKLRAGYGVTGNQRIPSDQYFRRFESAVNSSSYPINGTVLTGMWLSDYDNSNVKWEQVSALNLGIDFSILNGDLDGSFDWYNKKTTDMLYRLPLPAIAVGRANSPYVNVGEMQNKGIEFSLNYHYGKRQQRPFTLDLSANISRNINKVVSLAPSISQDIYGSFRSMETSLLKAGEPLGSFFGYKVIGIYQSASDVASSPSYELARAGGLKYEDINGDGKIDASDRTVIGSPHPDFVYSFNISGAYKNFDFMMYFYGSQGNQNYEATRYFTDFGVFKGQKSVRVLDEWSPTNTSSMIPSQGGSDVSSLEYASSSYYIQDASFLKLKNLQIGYSLPTEKIFKSTSGVRKLRVYFGVTNLFTITKYEGLDPEVSATPSDYPAFGVDFGVYPQSRQYMLGLSLGF
ncbi:SusC/RagA family TonB-linked outer membrane protein [Sphingobacterium spiritivorum]|uniref:SusC/RagA family TonB-linked outer membrane protein n=1 Tax=Sphingobacterium spiritivorum TaxID=258 RepID=UPI00191B8691|nr:TonB-dependent receptor [Sphingobacterium spiritivorum]QQT25396.1 TonB-dependent receptor [Sphingobacterium spiritivorum]